MLSAASVRSVLERFFVRSCNVVQLGPCSVCRIVFLVAGSVSAWQVAQPRRWLLHCLLKCAALMWLVYTHTHATVGGRYLPVMARSLRLSLRPKRLHCFVLHPFKNV